MYKEYRTTIEGKNRYGKFIIDVHIFGDEKSYTENMVVRDKGYKYSSNDNIPYLKLIAQKTLTEKESIGGYLDLNSGDLIKKQHPEAWTEDVLPKSYLKDYAPFVAKDNEVKKVKETDEWSIVV